MITHFFRTIKDSTLKKIDGVRNGVWVHAENPSADELTALCEKLSLDMAILDDAQDFFEVPRLERSEGVTYFFTRYPYDEQTEEIDTAPLLIVIGESFLLTVAKREVPQLGEFMKGNKEVHTTQKTKLFIQIMQAVTISFEKQLVRLRRAVHKDRVKLQKIGNKEIIRFVNYENKLNDMVAAVLPTNVSLQQVIGGSYIQVFEDDRELVDDLRIDNAQIVESARALLKTIQNVRTAAEAILANDLNNRIKILTVLTMVLTIPTIIFSLYGMNVPLPLSDSGHSFWLVIGSVVVIVGAMLWYFKRNEWL